MESYKNEEILLLLENPDLIDEISDYFEGLWQQTFLLKTLTIVTGTYTLDKEAKG